MADELTLPFGPEESMAAPVRAETAAARLAWGNFSLLARVGHGSFGEVYRAWDPHLQREVALKLLLPSAVSGNAEYELMLREARALASVKHPNVVSVYGIDRHEERVGFWTDFVHGKTLSVLLGAQGPFGYREAALIGLDVAKALCAVHKAGILHRDIKAENVMREEGGRILLMDFGLSTVAQRQTNLAGTPNYMAPELFDGSPATVASDIYAAGVLLYFLVTGTHPAKLGGLTTTAARAAIGRRKPLGDLRPDLPEPFLRAVCVATEMDPAKRFSSAGQLVDALAGMLQGAPARPLQHPLSRPSSRRWIGLGVAAVVVIAAGLATQSPAVKGLLARRAAGASASTYEQYQKAEGLLLKSYKHANTAAAVKGFKAVLAADPKFAMADARLGSAYFVQYRDSHDPRLLDQAQAATDRAIELDPNLGAPYVTLARMAAMEGNTGVAMQQAQKALELDPRSAEAYRAISEVYDAEGRSADAIAAVQKAADLAPDDWRWPVSLGAYYFAGGRLRDAAEEFRKGVQLDPNNSAAYYDLGFVDLQLDQLNEARLNLEHSLRIEPASDTYELLGEVSVLQGKYPEAAELDTKAAELNPNDYVAWGDLGAAYLWTPGGHEKAMNAYRTAIRLADAARTKDPKNPNLLVLLAEYYASSGEKARSVVLLRQALALSGDDPTVSYRAGETYEILGERAKAMPLIAKALSRGYHSSEFEHDPELASLRKDPEFDAALRQAKAQNVVDSQSKMN